jgi:hypothetical protein
MSFTAKIESNIDEVIETLQKELSRRPVQELEIVNEAEYASYLHAREAYWVMNDGTAARIAWEELNKALEEATEAGEVLSDARIKQALASAADRIVAEYQWVADFKHDADPPRRMHWGKWADLTENLVKSFKTYVTGLPEKSHPYRPNNP